MTWNIPLQTRSTFLFDHEQYAVEMWCFTCILEAKLFIMKALHRELWSATSQIIFPKLVIHLLRALVTTSLSVSSLGYDHVYELRSSLKVGMYFSLLSTTIPVYIKSSCTTSLESSLCNAVANGCELAHPLKTPDNVCMPEWSIWCHPSYLPTNILYLQSLVLAH